MYGLDTNNDIFTFKLKSEIYVLKICKPLIFNSAMIHVFSTGDSSLSDNQNEIQEDKRETFQIRKIII